MTRINHNISAMTTQAALLGSNKGLGNSLERLSTGLRINRAADDAAGLSVSESLRTQVRGTNVAIRNAGDGMALLRIAEGAANEVSAMLQRMRELAIQADNDTLTTLERSYLNQEFQALMREVERISRSTQYNGMTLLDGEASSFGVAGGAVSVLHIGANYNHGNIQGTVDTMALEITPVTLGALGLAQTTTSITNRTASFNALAAVDNAIQSVNTMRANLGSFMNRLDHAISNLQIQEVNMQAAESAIRDTDFAKETTDFTKNQILVQSATAMLAQANQVPQSVLSLLQ